MFLDGARAFVLAKRPPLTDDERAKFILAGQAKATAVGCTAMQGGPVSLEVAQVYARLDREGRLTQRAFLWAPLLSNEADFQSWVAFAHGLPKDGKVQISAFKGFADGTYAARTAALLAPYADDPSTRGELYVPQEKLNAAVIRANRAGFPVAIHATGDAAVRSALDAYERSKATLAHALLNRVEHASLVDPADAPRFGALGVAASVQPGWLYEFGSRAKFVPADRVGAVRSAHVYPWNDLAHGGAFLLFGSDLPSGASVDPIMGIYGAAVRKFSNGEPFTPEQRVDADVALRAYTTNPAVAVGWGDRLGKIAAGYEADLVLLDRDPRGGATSTAEDPIRGMWVAGKPVRAR
jgi:predicted amidohydrolase YtcJ